MRELAFGLITALMLAGCGAVNLGDGQPGLSDKELAVATAGFNIAARQAAVRLIHDADKAKSVASVAAVVGKGIEEGALATLEDVEAEVRARVDFANLAPADRLLAEDLLDIVRLAAVLYVDDTGVDPSATRTLLAAAVRAVADAATLRAAMLGAPIPIPPVAGQGA